MKAPLGLDSRSAWIKEIAKDLYRKYGNTIHSNELELQHVLGKKRKYLLNAVKCFAFGKSTTMFDVNVKRILESLFYRIQK